MARRVEDLGFSTLVVPDHFDGQLSPVPALMAAADATATLRIGTLVLNNDFRHPLSLAKEAATLDLLSDGRMELGLGAGFRAADYVATGIRCHEPAVRVERLEEAVRVIKQAFASEPSTFSGQHYATSGYEGRPAPKQTPLPILIGGGGPRMLRLAGREADIVGIAANLGAKQFDVARDYVADRIEQKVQWVREGAGERFSAVELQTMVVSAQLTDDRNGALEQVAGRFGVTPEQAGDALLLLIGSVDEMTETLISRRYRFGISYIVFFDADMETVAPIVAALAAT
jgi:probable F420-dependent oxidoreductase